MRKQIPMKEKGYSKNPLVQLLVDNEGNYLFEKQLLLKEEKDMWGNKVIIIEEIYLER